MSKLSQIIGSSRKIVIKIGSNVLSTDSGTVNNQLLHNIVEQACELMKLGKQVIIVSNKNRTI